METLHQLKPLNQKEGETTNPETFELETEQTRTRKSRTSQFTHSNFFEFFTNNWRFLFCYSIPILLLIAVTVNSIISLITVLKLSEVATKNQNLLCESFVFFLIINKYLHLLILFWACNKCMQVVVLCRWDIDGFTE